MARSRLPLTPERGRARPWAGPEPFPGHGSEGGPGRGAAAARLTSPAVGRGGSAGSGRAPCCSSCLVLLLAMWLGCIWHRTMIFLTLQRSWKILRRMWKPRRNLPMTSPEREMFPRSTLCVQQGCNFYLSGSKGQVEGWHGRLLHS